MPLVSPAWASALSGHSFAWEQLDLKRAPPHLSKLTTWADAHCKLTHQLSIEGIQPGSEDVLHKLLASSFQALRSIKLTGSISSNLTLWSRIQTHHLQHLHLELESITHAALDSASLMPSLEHLSLQACTSDHAATVHLPGQLTTLTNLVNLSLRNISAALGVVAGSFTVLSRLEDLTLVRVGISHFDFSFGKLTRLSSLLLSEDHRSGQVFSLPGLSELSVLKRLSISNGLEKFPDDVLYITSLTSLDLGWNKFRILPDGPYLRNLRELQFQERPSVLDISVLEKAPHLSLLSFDVTHMVYKAIIALVMALIRRLPNLHRVVLLKATYNGAADREDQIAQSFLWLVNELGQDMVSGKSIQIDLEHRWRPLLWADVSR